MRIGIIKFGTVINKDKVVHEGQLFEVINLCRSLESCGHEVVFISKHNLLYKTVEKDDNNFDVVLAFSGPISKTNCLSMLKNYTEPYIQWLNFYHGPWVYINTDFRYSFHRNNSIRPLSLKHIPSAIWQMVTDEHGETAHLDKIGLIHLSPYQPQKQASKFMVAYNDTNKKRSREYEKWFNFISQRYACEVYGKNISKFNSGIKDNKDILKTISQGKYSLLLSVNPFWCSQKFWECIIAGQIPFIYLYDTKCQQIDKDDFLRVIDLIELEQKVDTLESDKALYEREKERLRQRLVSEMRDFKWFGEYYTEKIRKIITR